MIAHQLADALKRNMVGIMALSPDDPETVRTAREQLRSILNGLPEIQKFDFGDLSAQAISTQGPHGLALFGLHQIRLPFNNCYFEHTWQEVNGAKVTSVYLAVQGEALPADVDLIATEFRFMHPLRVRLPGPTVPMPSGWRWPGLIVGLSPMGPDAGNLHVLADLAGFGQQGQQELERQCLSILSPVCLMSALLAQPSTTAPVRQAPKFTNREREKKGKAPIFSHHVVTLRPESYSELQQAADAAQAAAPRSSPRLHLRRGHVRRLATGRQIWVRACTVGNASLGTVSHDYRYIGAEESAAA